MSWSYNTNMLLGWLKNNVIGFLFKKYEINRHKIEYIRNEKHIKKLNVICVQNIVEMSL